MPYKVSVVTPSFRQGHFIERTIRSVIGQQFPGELEYLVIDGGSPDSTVSILERYGDRLQWVSEKDGGQADAVNKGLARAGGDIIGWLNSDDVYYPGAIAAVCAAFDAHPEADLIYGDANHIDEKDEVIDPYPTEPWNFDRLLTTCFVCQPAVFFRRSVVERFGPLDAKRQWAMDYEYWIRLGAQGANFFWLRRPLAGSRLYAQNKTLGSRARVHAEINDILRQRTGHVPDRWLFNYAHAVLDGRGIPRTAPRFLPMAAALSLYASLRWNHRLSTEVVRAAGFWTVSGVRESLRRKPAQ